MLASVVTVVVKSESLDDKSDASCFLCFRQFFFLSPFFLIDVLELLSFNKLDFFDDESDDDGSVSGSPGAFSFPFCSGKSVGSVGKSVGGVSDVGSGVFIPRVIESIGDIVPLFVFEPRGVESKGGQLIEIFWCPKS